LQSLRPVRRVAELLSLGDGEVQRAQPLVNWFHRHVCRSGRWRRRLEGELLPWTLQRVELGDDVLEVGPGPGLTTELLLNRAKRLTALEVETNAATALRQRLGGSTVRVVHGDGAAMPFEDGSFSAVVAFTMLHHIPTLALQDQFLAEARRVLRPGGVFAGFDGVDSLAFRLIHLSDTYTPVDPDTFGQRLEAAGFAGACVERGRGRFRFCARRHSPIVAEPAAGANHEERGPGAVPTCEPQARSS